MSHLSHNHAGCFIGLDIGSSAIKGVATNHDGDILAETHEPVEYLRPQEKWLELEPETHYRSVCRVIRRLVDKAPGKITALAMAAASGNALLTETDGTPLTRIISWMDGRSVGACPDSIRDLKPAEVRNIVGWPLIEIFPLSQLAWMREHQPTLFAQAGHIAMNTDWLLHKLTGEWVMDESTATTFHLQHQESRRYHAPFLGRLGISEGQLSTLLPSGHPVGTPTEQAMRDTGLSADTIISTGCFDHPAAARACGITAPGQLMFSCGTSWVGFMPWMSRQALVDAELLVDPFHSADGGAWAGMFPVPAIGPKIDWYIDHLIAPGEEDRLAIFNDLANAAKPGANGLVIDLREPPHSIDAERHNISRAVMEGAARLLAEKQHALQDRGFHFESAVMVGGPAESDIWPTILAEFTGLEVSVGTRSVGAQGAALLAAQSQSKTGDSR